MSTPYEDLSTYWTAQIAAQTDWDAGRTAEATIYLADWITALEALATAKATDITSYSVAGRSVARRRIDEMDGTVSLARRNFMVFIHGSVTLADFNVGEETISVP